MILLSSATQKAREWPNLYVWVLMFAEPFLNYITNPLSELIIALAILKWAELLLNLITLLYYMFLVEIPKLLLIVKIGIEYSERQSIWLSGTV